MDKKEISLGLTIICLTVLFMVCSIALFLMNGKSKFWTARKLRYGALILSFSTVTTVFQSCCYKPVIEFPENNFIINEGQDTLNFKNESTVLGRIENPYGEYFSFLLQNDNIISSFQKNDIIPVDSVFDEASEDFILSIDTLLVQGDYTLNFFTVKQEDQQNTEPVVGFDIKIINGK